MGQKSSRSHGAIDIAARVMAATSDAIVYLDETGLITYWSGAAQQLFGRAAADAIGRPFAILLSPEQGLGRDRELAMAAAIGGLAGTTVEVTAYRADGSAVPIELLLAHWGAQPGDGGFAAIIRDVSKRKVIEDDRLRVRALLDAVSAHLPVMVSVKEAKTKKYVMINKAGEALLGKSADQIVGHTIADFLPDRAEKYGQRDDEIVRGARSTIVESAHIEEDGSVTQWRTKRVLIAGPDGPDQYILGVTEDVTDLRLAAVKSEIDTLTGLINRTSYVERLNRLTAAGTPLALLKIDISRFRSVNDQFGPRLGDRLLVQVAERLLGVAGMADLVARIGADEFAMILLSNQPASRAQGVAEAVVDGLAKPFQMERVTVHSGASVGISISPDHAHTSDDLRRCVELALHRAKQQGRNSICRFNAEMDAVAHDRQMLELDLRGALDAGAITLAYQPVIAVETGQIVSVEALARWTHAVSGPIRPDIFISLAEECGLIHQLGEQVLRRACRDALHWPEHLRVGVNLSPLQFQHGDLFATVCTVLAETGLPANRLQLEVTEGLLIRDTDSTFALLERLRALGIQILMDDFGVGYSSLSYFERFRFDKVKIDRSFIASVAGSQAAKAIIKAVVGLGQQLEMDIVAEGVETADQVDFLAEAGCTHLQGYLFGRPEAASVITARVWADQDSAGTARAA